MKMKIKYHFYVVRCQLKHEIPWDFITWLGNILFIRKSFPKETFRNEVKILC